MRKRGSARSISLRSEASNRKVFCTPTAVCTDIVAPLVYSGVPFIFTEATSGIALVGWRVMPSDPQTLMTVASSLVLFSLRTKIL